MWIRMKDKYFKGSTASKNLISDDPVLLGCEKYDKRRELKDKLKNGAISQEQYSKLLRTALGLAEKKKGKLNKKGKAKQEEEEEEQQEQEEEDGNQEEDGNEEQGKKTEKGKRKAAQQHASTAIELQLQHGDLVVMHGPNLQKYYEVSASLGSGR
jgi:hypothetical protein